MGKMKLVFIQIASNYGGRSGAMGMKHAEAIGENPRGRVAGNRAARGLLQDLANQRQGLLRFVQTGCKLKINDPGASTKVYSCRTKTVTTN